MYGSVIAFKEADHDIHFFFKSLKGLSHQLFLCFLACMKRSGLKLEPVPFWFKTFYVAPSILHSHF